MPQRTDQFANVANLEVTESAAGTLTFEQLQTGAGIFEKVAMVIHRIEYDTTAANIALVTASDDQLDVAWTTSDQITNLAKNKAQVIDRLSILQLQEGTPANMQYMTVPFIHDFTALPGGGLIVPATVFYLGIVGTSLASAAFFRSSMYFTYKQLKPEEYWELVEATRALS